MTLFFFILAILVWLGNSVITLLFVVDPIIDDYFDEPDFTSWFWRESDTVETIFQYHEPWRISAWFGFKHWFIPFKEPT